MAGHPAAALAHGDERRLGVARALATEPRFVLMDEPAAGLPEAEVPEFAAVVRSVRDDHEAGVLLIDHNMALVMEVCDRIQVLDQGRTLAPGRPPRSAATSTSPPRTSARRLSPDARDQRTSRCATAPVPAVRDLTLRLGKGELVGLIGPNGAGKSTTLHAVSGLLPAHAGDVTLDGRSLRGRAPESIARAGISLVPEGRRIFADFSVEENLKLGLGRAARRRRRARSTRRTSSSRGCASSASRSGGALSGGEQQQLAIARALLARPSVLLLDEPSLGLAPLVVDAVFEALGAHPRARRRDPARRAARAAHGRRLRAHARARERRAAHDPRTRRRGRHARSSSPPT